MLPANHLANQAKRPGLHSNLGFKKASLLMLLLMPQLVFSQPLITRVEWFLDTDPGYGNGTPISIPSAANISNLSFSINISSLTDGVHMVGVRSRDANGAWSHDNKQLFVKPYSVNNNNAVPSINRVEWFLDNDPGYGNGTPISIDQGADLSGLSFSVNLQPLTEGVHFVGARSRNVNGSWSQDNKWLFVKPYSANGNAPVANITNVEWYLDSDPEYGNATPISVNPAGNLSNLSFSVSIPPLTEGVHIVGTRSRNANGAWSHDNKWLFVKPYNFNVKQNPDITKVEWYVDTDPGYGAATQVQVTPGTDLSGLSFSQGTAGLPAGIHLIGIRSQDANGAWSLDRKWIFINAYGGQPSGQLTQMEYYLDTDPGYGKGEQVALNPASNLPVKEVIANISGLTAGKHYIFFRSKDNDQAWSLDYRDSFNLASPQAVPSVNINSIAKKFMCEKDSFNVGYDLTGVFANGNEFKVFLSNAGGDFASETEIGKVTSTTDGSVRCFLPAATASGNGFKIRLKSTNPVLVGAATPFSLNLYDKPFFANDTTLFAVCGTDVFNLNNVFPTSGFKLNWNTLNTNAADTGSYHLIAINSNGCSDTVNVTIGFEVARWTGAFSSNWHLPGNWNINKVPTATTHVIIEGGKTNSCIISIADAVAASIQVKPGANLKASNGKMVTVEAACNALPN